MNAEVLYHYEKIREYLLSKGVEENRISQETNRLCKELDELRVLTERRELLKGIMSNVRDPISIHSLPRKP